VDAAVQRFRNLQISPFVLHYVLLCFLRVMLPSAMYSSQLAREF